MTTNEPFVSVCLPLYNAERFVASAISGVLQQTYRNFELIICDNCSTDRSLEIVEQFARAEAVYREALDRPCQCHSPLPRPALPAEYPPDFPLRNEF